MRAYRPKRGNISKTFGLLLFRPLRGHLPLKGKALEGACDSPVRAKAPTTYQREGQAPPLRYDEIRRITYYLESRLLAAAPCGASIRSEAENCHRRNSFPP